jgi:hypothetical protein
LQNIFGKAASFATVCVDRHGAPSLQNFENLAL